jgi:ATP-dependent Lhr-like helicase
VGGAKVPPQIQRMKSEDLLATVFPDQVACLENIVGERKIPDHPLVEQTLQDCLYDAMDLEGLVALLRKLEAGEVTIVARDLTAPSSLCAEVLGARPYAYLDDAPLEERRTQAVVSRGFTDAGRAEDLGKLDADAIAAVREEAWPQPRDADEMHEALLALGAITDGEAAHDVGWNDHLEELVRANRATRMLLKLPLARKGEGERACLWVAAEMLPMWRAIHPDAAMQPAIEAPAEFAARNWSREDALLDIVRGRLGCVGPTRVGELAQTFGASDSDIAIALAALEREGGAMRGRFTPGAYDEEWCDRHLLARIHRRTLQRLRREIEPVAPRDFMRFLADWQHVSPGARLRGPDALAGVLAQLEGFEAAAGAWESQLLPARVAGYDIAWLDALCGSGRIAWTRLRAASGGAHASPVRASPIVLLPRKQLATWNAIGAQSAGEAPALSSRAQAVVEFLSRHGASFFGEIADGTRLLKVELEDALGELVGAGMVGADSFAGLRALLLPTAKRRGARQRRLARHMLNGIEDAGRWSLIRRGDPTPPAHPGEGEHIEHIARTLLRRWGVLFWKLLQREAAWLPPWRDLRRVYQRLEARGEIRGGRFVEGMVGEQFALPEAVEVLRRVRKREHDGALVAVSGADPLNLVGDVVAGPRVPAVAASRIAYRDGLPVAIRVAGEVTLLEALSPEEERALRARMRAVVPDRRLVQPLA